MGAPAAHARPAQRAAAEGLELCALQRRFGHVVALDGLSFAVAPGQLYGLVGANGAGKTTAMRLIMGIDHPDGGEVRWRGEALSGRRVNFGYLPEERGLYPKMTAADQLAYLARLHGIGAARARSQARAWLRRLGLGERADDRVERLSLGNQQRVQLAAALVHEPELLVLDEPFSGLDPVAVDTMSAILVEYAHDHGVPVLFSSHQLELVEALCDAVAIVDRGRMVASGGIGELRERGRRQDRRLWVELEGRDGRLPPEGWARRLEGVQLLEDRADGALRRTLLRLDDGSPDARDAVLRAGLAAGSVVAFEEVRPSLADLYRQAVGAPGGVAGGGGGSP